MPSSPIRRLVPFAEQAKARGIQIFHLNIGQPDVESPAEFWAAIDRARPKVLEYSHSAGTQGLRDRVRRYYASIGIELEPHELIVTTAGSEAVLFAMMSCLNPGEQVLVPEPFYANYLGFATACGVEVVPLTTRIEDDFALPDADDFAAKIGLRTKAILICNPSNPTGTIFDKGQLEELREIVLRHDLFLISDEVYREFNYTGSEMPSVLQLPGLEQHAVMCDSVSKRFSLCGARIGFLASHNGDLMQAAVKFAQARLAPPMLEQIGVEGAMETPPAYFEAMRDEYRARRDLLVELLGQMEGVTCPKIDGAFYAMVRLPIDDADRFCQWLLECFEHNGKTVMMAPGTGFYDTQGRGLDEVRIAYVLNRQAIGEAMECLAHALAVYPGRVLPVPA